MPPATKPPAQMDHHDKSRLRAAAFRVTRLYPGPAGEILSREIMIWEEFGYRFGAGALIPRLVDYVLKAPLPNTATAVDMSEETV